MNSPMRPLQLSMTGAAGVYLGAFVKNINAFAAAFPYCLAKSSSVSKCLTALAGHADVYNYLHLPPVTLADPFPDCGEI